MATKREIAADLREQVGNSLTRPQLQQYLGLSQHTLDRFLLDVPFIRIERKKIYLAVDVARKIYELQQTVI